MTYLQRKPMRLSSYDYTENGIYFITICTFHKKNTLGQILCRKSACSFPQIVLSPLGEIAAKNIRYIDEMNNVSVDNYVIMPNHIHLLVRLNTPYQISPKNDICRIIGSYKSKVSNEWLKICKSQGKNMGGVWQRSFMDHVVRSKTDYLSHWQYIENNPLKWEMDQYFNNDYFSTRT